MKRILYIFCLLLLFTACEQEIEYKGEQSEPKLVIQAEMGEGDTLIACYVARSRFFLESSQSYYFPGMSLAIDTLRNVTLTMESTSPSVTVLSEKQVGNVHYLSLATPLQVGDRVKLTASHPELGTAEAEALIVPSLQGEVLQIDSSDVRNGCGLKLRLHDYPLTDVVLGVQTFLYATERYEDESSTELWFSSVSSNDEMFAFLHNAYSSDWGFYANGILLFPSNYEEGRVLDLKIRTRDIYDSKRVTVDSVVVVLSAMSEDYYLYYRSMSKYIGMDTTDDTDLGSMMGSVLGVEEPVTVYTNVNNGYGIIAGKSKYVITCK